MLVRRFCGALSTTTAPWSGACRFFLLVAPLPSMRRGQSHGLLAASKGHRLRPSHSQPSCDYSLDGSAGSVAAPASPRRQKLQLEAEMRLLEHELKSTNPSKASTAHVCICRARLAKCKREVMELTACVHPSSEDRIEPSLILEKVLSQSPARYLPAAIALPQARQAPRLLRTLYRSCRNPLQKGKHPEHRRMAGSECWYT